ncbi:MAG: hypothetical protein ACI8Z5_001614, partial [Lentimonas sp.]
FLIDVLDAGSRKERAVKMNELPLMESKGSWE